MMKLADAIVKTAVDTLCLIVAGAFVIALLDSEETEEDSSPAKPEVH
jgi:hypothetical protein